MDKIIKFINDKYLVPTYLVNIEVDRSTLVSLGSDYYYNSHYFIDGSNTYLYKIVDSIESQSVIEVGVEFEFDLVDRDFKVIYDSEESNIVSLIGQGLDLINYWDYDKNDCIDLQPNTNYLVLDYNPFKYLSQKYNFGLRNTRYNNATALPRIGIANNINLTFCYSSKWRINDKLEEMAQRDWDLSSVPEAPILQIINTQDLGVEILNKLDSLDSNQYYGYDYETNRFPDEVGFKITGLGISTETESYWFDYRKMGISGATTMVGSPFLLKLHDFLTNRADHCIVYNCSFEIMATYRSLGSKWHGFYDLVAINTIKNRGLWNSLKWTARLLLNVNSWDDDFEGYNEKIDECSSDNFRNDLLEFMTESQADEVMEYYKSEPNENGLYYIPQDILGKYCGLDCYYTLMSWLVDTKDLTKDCIDVYCKGRIFETRLNEQGLFKDTEVWNKQIVQGKKYMLQAATCLLNYYYYLAIKENDALECNTKITDYNELTQYFLKLGYDNNQPMYNFAKSLMARYYNENCEWSLDSELIKKDLGEELGSTFISYIWEAVDTLDGYTRKRKIFTWLGDLLEPYISKVTDSDSHEVMMTKIIYDKYLEDIKNFPWVGINAEDLPDEIDFQGEKWSIQDCLSYVLSYANVNSPTNKSYLTNIYLDLNFQKIFMHFRSRDWDYCLHDRYNGDLLHDFNVFCDNFEEVVAQEGEIISLGDSKDPDRVSKSLENITEDDYSLSYYATKIAEDYSLSYGWQYSHGNELRWMDNHYPGYSSEIQSNTFKGVVIQDESMIKFLGQFIIARKLFDRYYKSTYTYLEGTFYKYDRNYKSIDSNWIAGVSNDDWDDNEPSKSYNRFTANSQFSHRWSSGFHTVPSKSQVKKCMGTPNDAFLIYYDVNALEVRVSAYCSGDPKLISDFEHGEDPYIKIAKLAFPDASEDEILEARGDFKVVLLGWIYGRGISSLSEQLNISYDRAKELQSILVNQFVVLGEFIKSKSQFPLNNDGLLDTILGNIIYSDGDESKQYKHGINGVIQNFASVLVVYGFNNVLEVANKKYNCRMEPCSMVHDSCCNYFDVARLWDINKITKEGFTDHIKDRFRINLKFDLLLGTNYYDVVEIKSLNEVTVEVKGTNLAINNIFTKLHKNNIKFKVEFNEPNEYWDEVNQVLNYDTHEICDYWLESTMESPIYKVSNNKTKCRIIKVLD